jgi:heme oxygenase
VRGMDNVILQGSDDGRKTLRLATKPAHERLHTNAAFAALLRGDLTLLAYQRLLTCLLGLHEPIEDSLGRFPASPLLEWRSAGAGVSRTAALRSDLAALGVDQLEIEAAPRAHALLPPLDDAAAALGCAWVVEGSALGGRIMSSRVDAMLSLGQGQGGGSFFSCDPGQRERWRGCCDAVEICGAEPDGLTAMIRAAMITFAVFETWLDKSL